MTSRSTSELFSLELSKSKFVSMFKKSTNVSVQNNKDYKSFDKLRRKKLTRHLNQLIQRENIFPQARKKEYFSQELLKNVQNHVFDRSGRMKYYFESYKNHREVQKTFQAKPGHLLKNKIYHSLLICL